MPRLGVLGWPVAHSLSPAMHNAALAALGLDDWRYQHLPVPPELFAETVRALPAAGFVGANVTVPHKHAALELADDVTERGRAIGAVNTLRFDDGRIEADNTDAPGMIAALPRGVDGARALVLGAGGAGRAAVWALRDAGAEVAVWNRTPARARALCAELGGRAVDVAEPADVLVNTTTVGMGSRPHSTFKELPVTADEVPLFQVVVDFVYRNGGTELVAAAREQGCDVVDGLEILVKQGALSLELWTGTPAPLSAMTAAVARA